MTKTTYENEIITQTLMTTDMLTGMAIGTLQEDFLLNEADFLRLKNEVSSFSTWALNVLFATIGYAISILPKWISELAGRAEHVSASEWTALIIGLVLAAILYTASHYLPNEKNKLMKRMDQHFKDAPKSRQIFRGQR